MFKFSISARASQRAPGIWRGSTGDVLPVAAGGHHRGLYQRATGGSCPGVSGLTRRHCANREVTAFGKAGLIAKLLGCGAGSLGEMC